MAELPRQTGKDITYGMIKGAVGSVPGVGSLAAEVFSLAVQAPIERKRDNFLKDLADKVDSLTDDMTEMGQLFSDDRFISTLFQGINIHMQTTGNKKAEYLQNAAINSVVLSPEEDIRLKFMSTLQTIGIVHIEMLKLFNEPYGYLESKGFSVSMSIEGGTRSINLHNIFLKYDSDFLNLVVHDLSMAGLIRGEQNYVTLNASRTHSTLVSAYGTQFIEFINKPDDLFLV
jgi:hypothetical protein